MCAVLRTLRYGKHLWQFSLNYRLHSFLNLKMKQTETHKKETHIHCQFAGSRFITLKENPGVYPCIPTDCLRIVHPRSLGGGKGGGGERGQCQKFVTSLVCLLHPTESEHKNLLRDRAYDFLVIPDILKIKQINN